jgi:peptidoglycan/xylan/chitin deacetylase (PgdA/CDA1 family)
MRAILTWHSIDRTGSPISVSPEQWRHQVAWLRRDGVRVLSIPDLLADANPGPAVALTFDDGFANFITEALPVLETHGFPATIFAVSGHVGGDNRWRGRSSTLVPRLPLLSWEELGRLPDDLVTIGAHTRTHPHLDQVSDESQIEDELLGCALEIERHLGQRPPIVAYPYGGVSPAVVRIAGEHFRWGCTTELQPLGATDHPVLLPRLDVYYLREPARLGAWGSARLRSWLWLRRGGRRLRALASRGAAA